MSDSLRDDRDLEVDCDLYSADCPAIPNISEQSRVPLFGLAPSSHVLVARDVTQVPLQHTRKPESRKWQHHRDPQDPCPITDTYDLTKDHEECFTSEDSGLGSIPSGYASGPQHYSHSNLPHIPESEKENLTTQIDNLSLGEAKVELVDVEHVERTDSGFASGNIESTTPSVSEVLPAVPHRITLQNLFTQDEDGDTPLHMAVIQQDSENALRIMSLATSMDCVNFANNYHQTPLHLSVLTNQSHLIRPLLICGAIVDTRDRNGNTALHLACRNGDLTAVQLLTQALHPDDLTCMPYHVPHQDLPQDLAIKNYTGETCLHLAAMNNHVHVLAYLVKVCRADVNMQEGKRGLTVLHQCSERNQPHLVQLILQSPDLMLEVPTYDQCTALRLALNRGNDLVAKLLRDAGAQDDVSEDDDLDSTEDEDDMVSLLSV